MKIVFEIRKENLPNLAVKAHEETKMCNWFILPARFT